LGSEPTNWRGEVQQTLRGFANVFASYRAQYQWEPQPDSPAALGLAREEEFAGAWSDEPVADLLLGLVALQVTSAVEHLEALTRLLDDEPMVFAPATVTRAVLEAAGRCWWLLDPNLPLDQCLHRAITERLYGLWEDSKYPEAVGPKAVWERKIERILGEAEARGIRNGKGSTYVAPYVGAKRPAATQLIRDLLGSPELGSTLYRHLSGIAHATPSLGMSIDPEAAKQGLTTAHLVIRPDSVILLTTAGILGFSSAFDRLLVFYGWDPWAWAKWRQFGVAKLSRMLNEAPSPERRHFDPDEVEPPSHCT
jgi:hypothetical protein